MKRKKNNLQDRIIGVFCCILWPWIAILHAQYSDHRDFKTDSLEHVLQATPAKDAESLARIYKDLMWAYSETDNERTMKYARLLENICRRENYTLALSNSLRMIGVQHYGNCNYDSALHYLHLSLETSARMADDERYETYQMEDEQILTYGSIGNVYNMQGMNTLAIENYERVMRTCEKYQWNETLASVYLNISELYFGMKNYKIAEEYVMRFDSLAHLTGDSLFIAKAHLEKAILYRSAYSDYDRALQHAQMAADYLLDNPEEGSWQLTCMHLLASINLLKGELAEAEKQITHLLTMSEEMESPYDIASALALQAKLHSQRKEWQKVLTTGEKALTYNDMEPANTLGIYKLLGEASAQFGDADGIIKYYGKALDLQASWSNENHQSALAEQKVRYETEQKELRIGSLEQEKRLITWLALSGGLLTLLVLLLLFYQNRLHRHQRKLLATQVALESETTERQRIARDLHDGLGGMLSAVKLQMSEKHYEKALELLDASTTEMRRMAHHLMPESLIRLGLITALEDFALTIPQAHFSHHGFDKRLEENMEITIYRTIHELVNNAVKHAEATRIDIDLTAYKKRITIHVADNGKGFAYSPEKEGFGLKNIRNRIAMYNGKLMVDSHPNRGTEINIEMEKRND